MPLQILVINEKEAFCNYLSDLLARQGHEVLCIQGVSNAVQESASIRPGLIILEISAAEMGAVEMIDRLQRSPATRPVPIIVISDMPELEFELLNLFDFLPQPLDPLRLAEDIDAIANGLKQSLPRQIDTLPEDDYQLFFDYLMKESGLHFDRRNLKILQRGLLNRMSALKIGSFREYYDYLMLYQESRQELKKLLPFLTIGETYFFRYHSHFAALSRILTEERSRLKAGEKLKLRLWSAGCSTGEEPYSLAITVMEAIDDWQKMDIRILATDIDNRALKRARDGIYSPWSMRVIEKRHLDRYFEKTGKKYKIRDEVKGLVEFAHHNLLTPGIPGGSGNQDRFDVIFCRNVTIYFTIATTREIIEKLSGCLKPRGYLFLGHAETLNQISSRFERHCYDGGFYYREKAARDMVEHPDQPAPAPIRPKEPVKGPIYSSPKPIKAIFTLPPPVSRPDTEKLFLDARQLFNDEQFTKTVKLLEELLLHEPQHSGALILYGFTLANDGRFDEALEACERALKIDDLLPEAYYLKGLVLEMTDHLLEACQEYRKAILLENDFIMPHYQLSQLYARLGKNKEQLRELNNTMRIVTRMNEHEFIPFSGGLSWKLFMSHLKRELAKAGK